MNPIAVMVSIAGAAILIICLRQLLNGGIAKFSVAIPVMSLAVLGMLGDTTLFTGGRVLQISATVIVVGGSLFPLAASWGSIRAARVPLHLAAVPLLSLWMFAVNAVGYPSLTTLATFERLAPVLVWTMVVALICTRSLTFEDLTLIACAAFGLACVLASFVALPFTPCTQFKCGPFGALFAGPFTSENYFARLACVVLLCAFFNTNTRAKWLIVLTASFVLYATGSRTSQIALAAALLAAAVWVLLGLHERSMRQVVGLVLPAGVLGVGLYLVYTAGPADFSNRGFIWTLGRTALSADWLSGKGIDTWTPQVLERNYMHSQALLLLYSAGVVALVLYAVVIGGVIRSISSESGPFKFAMAVLILILGLTEIVWNPAAVDGTVLLILPLLGMQVRASDLPGTADMPIVSKARL